MHIIRDSTQTILYGTTHGKVEKNRFHISILCQTFMEIDTPTNLRTYICVRLQNFIVISVTFKIR